MHYSQLARPIAVPHGSRLYKNLCADPKWVAQEKVDGMRVLVRGVELISRHGKEVEPGPKLRAALKALPKGWEFDGELKDGVLHLFDVVKRVSHYSEPVKNMQFVYRWMVLNEVMWPTPYIKTVHMSNNIDQGFIDWTGNGGEGVVVKNLNDGYPPFGGAEWYKVKPGG
jgi:ATP-dependent DNA ligase